MNGKVDLKDILQESSISSLINTLAERASKTAISSYGKDLKPLISNLKNVSNTPIDESLIKEMKPYINMRSRIVHEGSEEKVKSKDVYEAFDILIRILEHFRQVAKNNGVPTEPEYP